MTAIGQQPAGFAPVASAGARAPGEEPPVLPRDPVISQVVHAGDPFAPLPAGDPSALTSRHATLASPQLPRKIWFDVLDTGKDLVGKAQRPKDDLFFGLWKRSVGYKQIIVQLEAYEKTLRAPLLDVRTTTRPLDRLRQAEGQLRALRSACDRYMAQDNHSRKGAVSELQLRIEAELWVVKRLMDELRQIGGGIQVANASQDLGTLMKFARQGIPSAEVAQLLERKATPEQARADLVRLAEATSAGRGPDTQKDALIYQAKKLDPGKAPPAREFRPEYQLGELKKIGSGTFNSTYLGSYVSSDGQLSKVVIKPVPVTEEGWAASNIGIPKNNPRTLMRNLAVCAIDRHLGFGVIVKTEPAIASRPVTDSKHSAEPQPELCMAMEPADGIAGYLAPEQMLKDPKVMQGLLRLQLVDALCGQGDRHGGNYRLNPTASGEARIKGFDNDQCFGAKITNPNHLAQNHERENGFRGVKLPPVIDRETANKFQEMSGTQLRELLAPFELTEGEVEAAASRLTYIKAHIGKCRQAGNIVNVDLLPAPVNLTKFTLTNSYIGRELANARMRF